MRDAPAQSIDAFYNLLHTTIGQPFDVEFFIILECPNRFWVWLC